MQKVAEVTLCNKILWSKNLFIPQRVANPDTATNSATCAKHEWLASCLLSILLFKDKSIFLGLDILFRYRFAFIYSICLLSFFEPAIRANLMLPIFVVCRHHLAWIFGVFLFYFFAFYYELYFFLGYCYLHFHSGFRCFGCCFSCAGA